MFHIFAGPLFANLAGYVFLDLLIWGVSPLLFEACRVPLRRYVQPGWGVSLEQKSKHGSKQEW
jgi:hypothetical protein